MRTLALLLAATIGAALFISAIPQPAVTGAPGPTVGASCLLTRYFRSYQVGPSRFETQSDLSAWSLSGPNVTGSPGSLSPPLAALNGSLAVTATLGPGPSNSTPSGQGPHGSPFDPQGVLFFSLAQRFEWSSGAPSSFWASAWVNPASTRNVSRLYVYFIVSGPRGNRSISDVYDPPISQRVVIGGHQALNGPWRLVNISSSLLGASLSPPYAFPADPSSVVFNGSGTYTFTVQIRGVLNGASPSLAFNLGAVTLATVQRGCGAQGSSVLSVSGEIAAGNSSVLGIAVNEATDRVYAVIAPDPAHGSTASVAVIDGATGTVASRISLPGLLAPLAVAVDQSSNRVYVTGRVQDGGSLIVIDGATDSVSQAIGVGRYVTDVAVDDGRHLVYVVNMDPVLGEGLGAGAAGFSNTVSVIDSRTYAIVANISAGRSLLEGRLPIDDLPVKVAVDTRSGFAFVATFPSAGFVSPLLKLSSAKQAMVGDSSLAHLTGTVAVLQSSGMVIVSTNQWAGGQGHVDLIDGTSLALQRDVKVGGSADYVAANRLTGVVYVDTSSCEGARSCDLPDTVYALDGSTGMVIGSVSANCSAVSYCLGPLAVNPLTGKVYAGGPGSSITVLSDGTPAQPSAGGEEATLPSFVIATLVFVLAVAVTYGVARSRQALPQVSGGFRSVRA